MAIPSELRNPNHVGHIAWVLSELGRTEEARGVIRQAEPMRTSDVSAMLPAAEALLHAIAGDRRQAAERIAVVTARAGHTNEAHHATYLVAAAHARLGNSDEALRWLRYTFIDGFPCYPLLVRDANLGSLRSNRAFIIFVDESRTRWEGYRKRLAG